MSIALTVHYNVSEILEDKWAGSMDLHVGVEEQQN